MHANVAVSPDEEVMTVRDAARRLGISAATLHKQIARGRLPAVADKHGKLVRLADVLPLGEAMHAAKAPRTRDSRGATQTERLEQLQHSIDQLVARVSQLEEAVAGLQRSVLYRNA
jgi:excisionase family DNA binding protein